MCVDGPNEIRWGSGERGHSLGGSDCPEGRQGRLSDWPFPPRHLECALGAHMGLTHLRKSSCFRSPDFSRCRLSVTRYTSLRKSKHGISELPFCHGGRGCAEVGCPGPSHWNPAGSTPLWGPGGLEESVSSQPPGSTCRMHMVPAVISLHQYRYPVRKVKLSPFQRHTPSEHQQFSPCDTDNPCLSQGSNLD